MCPALLRPVFPRAPAFFQLRLTLSADDLAVLIDEQTDADAVQFRTRPFENFQYHLAEGGATLLRPAIVPAISLMRR